MNMHNNYAKTGCSTYEGLQCKIGYIHFVNFSGQAMQTVTFMVFCIKTQTLKGILTAIYFVLSCEILPAGASQGEEEFSAEKRTCVNLVFIAFCIGALHIHQVTCTKDRNRPMDIGMRYIQRQLSLLSRAKTQLQKKSTRPRVSHYRTRLTNNICIQTS